MTTTRVLGRSGIEVSAIGMGCWAIGGPLWGDDKQPLGWGEVDDEESVRAVHAALDHGVTLFDTASNYGAGHSERVLGRALAGRRDRVVIATKFGFTSDEATRRATGEDHRPEYAVASLEASLRRLDTDHVDLYQLHLNDLAPTLALDLVDTLEALVSKGRIRAYGWSTDDPVSAAVFAASAPHCTVIQHEQSVLRDNAEMLAVCESHDLGSIARGPLAMGLLTAATRRLGADDVRGRAPEWLPWFADGRPAPQWAQRVARVRAALTSDGRTLAQGALGWLLARSPRTVPIPGFRTVTQVEENVGVLAHGPLPDDAYAEVELLLSDLRPATAGQLPADLRPATAGHPPEDLRPAGAGA
ncbi:Predicted oxidoreductase [Micromonospora phaseoli]|uniref:Predicted oxidoreductase n=1 Tax=Micromonospora phaseoli TaxID=1144548 RepID=A0A1H7CXE8_9ACTN|nr:aldo/keto reductase [Micromonospora phaseoli]PZV97996.1 aryl-alcohol dehydrogenase-like predicted oxidoreductase [Micromonospora phaseoli]GIJ81156.1 oxidoreductase [Micromonospora phaseoli]SEJ94166.1 Predicted oxidoreductase [Micromonospora phaseoli]